MKIHIRKNLYLEADQFQFILREHMDTFDKRSGRQKTKTIGYYTSLSGVVNKLIRLNLAECDATNLKEMREEMQRLQVWIKGLFADIEATGVGD